MELGEWIGGRIIENSDKRGSDNRGSTVFCFTFYIASNTYRDIHNKMHPPEKDS